MRTSTKAGILVLFILVFCSVFAYSNNIDMVVLLDTSESVFPIFDTLVELVVEDTIKNHLQMGDYFHLLSFAGSPQIEVSSQINTTEDIEKALKHIFLLQPLGQYTDLLRALQYLYHFTSDLPEGRKKYIVILTDGIHDPPPDSPFHPSKRNIEKELEQITGQIYRKNWDVRIIELPSTPTESTAGNQSDPSRDDGSGTTSDALPADNKGTNFIENLSEQLDTGIVEYPDKIDGDSSNEVLGTPSIESPSDLGDVSTTATIPIRVKNHDNTEKEVLLTGLYLDGKNILVNNPRALIPPHEEAELEAEIKLPEGMSEGEHTFTLVPEFESDLRFSPNEIEVHVNVTPKKFSLPDIAAWKYVLIIILVILFGFFVFFILRKMQLTVDSLFKRGSDYVHTKLSKGTAIELVVEGQNTQIGLRNVHSVSAGTRLCVGGDGSPFVIFLYPFPRCIGELTGSDEDFTFYPRRKEFFPEDMEPEVPGCLQKKITAVAANGKKVRFYFRKYISPLDRINKIMRLTKTPGPPDSDD